MGRIGDIADLAMLGLVGVMGYFGLKALSGLGVPSLELPRFEIDLGLGGLFRRDPYMAAVPAIEAEYRDYVSYEQATQEKQFQSGAAAYRAATESGTRIRYEVRVPSVETPAPAATPAAEVPVIELPRLPVAWSPSQLLQAPKPKDPGYMPYEAPVLGYQETPGE